MLLGMTLSTTAATLSLDVDVTNTLDRSREAVPVVIDLAKEAPGMRITSSKVTVGGREIASQLDDLDRDGVADELVTVVDIPAGTTATLAVTLSTEGVQADYENGTTAYIKLRDEKKKHVRVDEVSFPGDIDPKITYNSIYGHGAVMEGLHNALRIYMDNRQSIDLYGKSTPRLELDVTGFYTTPEQLAEGYGRDILWAGKSVAAGSFRGYRDGAPCTIDTVGSRGQAVLASGPVRSIVEVTDRDWMYNGRKRLMKQRYTVYAGRHDFDVEVKVSDIAEGDIFCTGIQKLETDNRGFISGKGLAGSYGSNIPDKKQPELPETLGLGLYVPDTCNGGMAEDEYNYLATLHPGSDGMMHYSVNIGAAREKDGFRDADRWFDNLAQWHKELATPCLIKIRKHN